MRLKRSPLLLLAFIDQLAVTISQQGLSILSEAFKQYAHLGIAQMGLLFSTVALGAVAGMIPAGLALGRYGVKRVAWVSGIVILAVMLTLAGVLPKAFLPLLSLLGLVGFFLPALSLTGTTAITQIYEGADDEGMAIGLRQAATPLGGIVAASLFPFLIKMWNLKIVVGLIALNVGLWRLLFAASLPKMSGRHRIFAPRHPSRTWFRLWAQFRVKLATLRWPLFISFLLSPGQYALLTYAILDLHDRWHFRMTMAGPIIALALFTGFIARIFMGSLSDRGVAIHRLISGTAALGAVSLWLWALLPSDAPLWAVVAIFAGLGAGLDGWNGLLTGWITEITTGHERGMSLGLAGMSGFIGIVLFLPVFGIIVRVFASYRLAWALLGLIYFAGLCVSRLAIRGASKA